MNFIEERKGVNLALVHPRRQSHHKQAARNFPNNYFNLTGILSFQQIILVRSKYSARILLGCNVKRTIVTLHPYDYVGNQRDQRHLYVLPVYLLSAAILRQVKPDRLDLRRAETRLIRLVCPQILVKRLSPRNLRFRNLYQSAVSMVVPQVNHRVGRGNQQIRVVGVSPKQPTLSEVKFRYLHRRLPLVKCQQAKRNPCVKRMNNLWPFIIFVHDLSQNTTTNRSQRALLRNGIAGDRSAAAIPKMN